MIQKILTYCFGLCAGAGMLVSCGHAGGSVDGNYAETICWEGDGSHWGEELSDSELDLQDSIEAAESASLHPHADTPAPALAEAGKSGSAEDPAEDTAPAGISDKPQAVRPGRLPVKRIGRLHEVFNDSNHHQLAHARHLGIEPITDISSYYNTRRPIVKIETNKDFAVDELKHSYPYLVPEAARLLHDIGRTFQDSLAARGGGKYRIIVTSVLRTPVTVRRLRRVNRNATQESTHQYGTTFDITYTRFESLDGKESNTQEDLKNLLGEVLHDLHTRGRCMVKYERKSPCFHITVVE
ncbi:MAG: hypothetical protein K2O78_05630 [Muribaculaceae bacterium]|nr:hypothetical protein [Muribaculaceae bacterium]